MDIRLTILGFSLILLCSASSDDGLCSQVYQMHEYCTSQVHGTPSITSSQTNQFYAKQGKAGPRGPPGVVNYTKIEENIQEKFGEMEDRFIAKMKEIEEKVLNDTIEKQTEFAELLRVAQELRPLTFSDCRKVTRDDAKTWNETGGIFDIFPNFKKLEVYCDLTTDGGGWMVFQRRSSGATDFYRNWDEYVNGFGSKSEEFWFGLEHLHRLTHENSYELRIDLEDWEGNKRHAKYSNFKIGSASSNYALTISGYSGDAGDSLSGHNGQAFTTKNRDNDLHSSNCAVMFKGAWWYISCHASNLKGHYFKGGTHKSYADGVGWDAWKGQYYSMKFVEMKMRKN